ncbi:MAG: carbohydrate ABC transporter permease [Halanaerobiaceae bacterium]
MQDIIHSKKFVIFIFLLPASFFCILYLLAPIPLSAYYSFFKWDGIGEGIFVSWGNWSRLLQDRIFWLSVLNNFKLVFLSLVIQIPMGIILAVFLSSKLKGSQIFKSFFFIPMLLSAVAVAFLWRYLFDFNFGMINNLLNIFGFKGVDWLGNPNIAFYSVVAPVSWRFIPLYMIIFMAGIAGIPNQLYEAAKIDGASSLQAFRKVTLPMLKPTIVSASILIIVGSLKYFAMVFALTGGGPNHASELMATYMYTRAFSELKMGYGSTISLALFLIAFIVSIAFLYITNRGSVRNG